MTRISGRLAGGGALWFLALACNVEKPVGPTRPSLDRRSGESSAPLVLHVVAPQATDPAIDKALDNHYVWLDTQAKSNHKLFVFLPGTGQNPSIFQLVQQEAARVGYHVIGLMYPTAGGLAKVCPTTPDPNACYQDSRLEIIDGIDRNGVVAVNVANSIDNRLAKLLEYLARQYPDEGWGRFLLRRQPKWSQIAISGHSQGGGNAAMIAKIRLVARVVLFSSVTDSIHAEAPSWVATHVTPAERYYGIAHDRDGFYRPIRAAWDSLRLTGFGAPATPETTNPPYDGTHTLVTDLTPQGGFVGTNAHGAPSNDLNTPLGPDGTPLLRDAWRYLMTAPSAADEDALARFDAIEASAAPLLLHVVAPQATDPAIDRFLDDHYVWLDTTARTNHKLFVFLPGTVVGSATPQRPAQFQLVQQEAARLGYHVIGLMYVNSGGIAQACPTDPDPATCYENARREVVDGIDRSPIVEVNVANSIDNRLTKLLDYLAARYPNEHWSHFLAHGQPKWSQIAISGHSGGGGFAAMIAKLRVVARVVLFASVTDSIGPQSVPWVASHMTPSERYYGLAHDRDSFFRPIRASWDSLGMAAFGSAAAPETSDPPYDLTHMLVTDVLPRGGFVGNNARGSVSNDANTPLTADGSPLFRSAWRYMLTARGEVEDIAERDED